MEPQSNQPDRLTPEQLAQAKNILETPVWETREFLNMPAEKVSLQLVERPYTEPAEARELRLKIWGTKLEDRLKVVKEANPTKKYEIASDAIGEAATNLPALFEINTDGTKKRTMWAGDTISMVPQGIKKDENGVTLSVYKVNYSELFACEDEEYRKMLIKHNIPMPDAGVGIVALMETKDGFMPLTRRGIETGVYPGRLHSIGGNPKPELSLLDNFREEITEEIGLVEDEGFDIKKLRILGIVVDKNFNGSPNARPEVVAYMPLGIGYRDVIEAQRIMLEKTGLKQEDVWALEPISTDRRSLESTIILHGYEMCPPLEAALAMLLFDKLQGSEGPNALKALEGTMNKVKSFERSNFQPPIKRMAR